MFFLSGAASLIYQVVWQRALTVHYGVGSLSITLIVTVYMAGLSLGALLGGYVAERTKDKLMVYVLTEVLLGVFGLISIRFLDLLGNLTAGTTYLRSFCCIWAFLLFPTLLMGLTLPLLIKVFNGLIRHFIGTVSYFYFINTLGAAFGAILAAYALISFYGLDSAVRFAAAINCFLALLAFFARQIRLTEREPISPPIPDDETIYGFGPIAYLLVFITGFLALGYEIIWFRVIGVLVKSTPYAFSSVLAVYLFGLALGSFGMNLCARRYTASRRRDLFFWIQVVIALYTAGTFIAYYYLTKWTNVAFLTWASFQVDLDPWINLPQRLSLIELVTKVTALGDILLWCVFFMLIPTILMGATFPLVSSLALSDKLREGKLVGVVYFYNVIGNVAGGLITGLLLLPLGGSEMSLLMFSVVGGCFVLGVRGSLRKSLRPLHIALSVGFGALVIGLFPRNGDLYVTMHTNPSSARENRRVLFEEGTDGVFVAFRTEERLVNYVNGLSHGGRPGEVFYAQALEAMRFVPKMESVLIIGLGTGSFLEAAQLNDDVTRIVLVELNHSLISNLSKDDKIAQMLGDRRLKIIVDDGRRHLLRTDERFDLIMVDPLRTTEAYSNNLYSRQFYDLVNKHLETGGIALLWRDEHMVVPRTRAYAFPYLRKYGGFCLASNAPFRRDEARFERVLESFSEESRGRIEDFLRDDLRFRYQGDREYVMRSTRGYPINQDLKPFTEYYLGLKLGAILFPFGPFQPR